APYTDSLVLRVRGLKPAVVPDADTIVWARRQIRNLEISAPEPSYPSRYICDPLTDYVATRVNCLREHPKVRGELAVLTGNVAVHFADIRALLRCCPFDGEVPLPAGHQRGRRHSGRRRGAVARASRAGRDNEDH